VAVSSERPAGAVTPRAGIDAPHGGCFVVGTDTGVGKTLVACALIHAMRRAGLSPVPFKPVASGCEESPDGLINDDTRRLIAASGRMLSQDEVSPYRYLPAIAPHVAAAEAGRPIQMDSLISHAAGLARHGPLVVEGAGGLLVPLDSRYTLADLAVALGLPMVLVVGMRLGCLNHALLTAEAITSRGLVLAGWVANRIDPDFERAAANIDTLLARLPAPLLGTVPWGPSPSPDPAAIRLSLPALH
jgi:dethiobiotin synthetase